MKMIPRSAVLLALLLALPAPASAAVGDWTSHTFANSVTGLAASGDDLWWATTGGAVRTDLATLETTVYHRERGTLVSDTLSTVCVDGAGVVWFGSSNRSVSGFDPSTDSWRRIQGIDGLPDARVNVIRCAGDAIWAGTARGFAEFENGVATANACEQGVNICGLVSYDVRDIFFAGETRWFATGAGVSKWTAGEWDTLDTGLPAGAATSIAAFGAGVWAVAAQAAYRLDGSEWSLASLGLAAGTQVRRVAVLGDALYAATSTGLYRWNEGWTRVGTFLNATVATIDATDRIWVGTAASGVYWWDGAAWRQVLAPGPLDDRTVRNMEIDADGTLWYTQRFSAIGLLEDGVWQKLDAGNTGGAFEQQWSGSVRQVSNGDVWIGHCCCNDDVNCRVDRLSADGAWSAFPNLRDVITIDEDPSGDLWLGTTAGGPEDVRNGVYFISREDSSQTRLLVGDTGGCLPSNQVPAILAPADGRVIFGSLGDGVALWDYGPSISNFSDDACTRYTVGTGDLPNDEVSALLLRGNDLWVGTAAGVAVVNLATGVSRTINTQKGLAGNQVTALAADPLGRIWVATRQGASVISVRGSSDQVESFGHPELVNEQVNAVVADARTGLVWFGTDRGLSSYEAWDPNGGTPSGFEASVYPNPFRPATTAGLRLLAGDGGVLHGEVYDLAGRRIATFANVSNGAAFWDGTLSSGVAAPSGHYLVVVRSASGAVAKAHVALLR